MEYVRRFTTSLCRSCSPEKRLLLWVWLVTGYVNSSSGLHFSPVSSRKWYRTFKRILKRLLKLMPHVAFSGNVFSRFQVSLILPLGLETHGISCAQRWPKVCGMVLRGMETTGGDDAVDDESPVGAFVV